MANKAEIWYRVSTRARDYLDLPKPDRLPTTRSAMFRTLPVLPVGVKKATDASLLLTNGRRAAKESRGVLYVPGLDEALFEAERVIGRYMQDYERDTMREFAEDMYAAILSGDVSRQRAIVSTISRKVGEERARFKGWRASVKAIVDRALDGRAEGNAHG